MALGKPHTALGRVAPAILSPVCFSGLEPTGDKIAGATL